MQRVLLHLTHGKCVLGHLLVLFLVFPSLCWAQSPFEQKLESLGQELAALPNAKISLQVTELTRRKKTVLALNEAQALIPASTVKIITSVAALRSLGPEYEFPTEVFVDRLPREQNVGLNKSAGITPDRERSEEQPFVGSLYVRGYGDPSMIDQKLWELARAISRQGVTRVKDIIIDDTLFHNPPGASGTRAYQAGISAVTLNHNSYALRIAPRGVGMRPHWDLTPGAPYEVHLRAMTKRNQSKLRISQSPSSTAFNPNQFYQKRAGRLLLEGTEAKISINGGIAQTSDTKTFYRAVPYVPSYFAHVFRELLEQVGVEVTGDVLVGATPSGVSRLLTYSSKPLSRIVGDLNRYSSNVIAAQLQFALGQDDDGRFRAENGLAVIRKVLEDAGFKRSEFSIVDASGLDRNNRLSAEQLVRVLQLVHSDFSEFPSVVSSLSRFGASGTLEDREVLSQEVLSEALRFEVEGLQRRSEGIWAKTGTLEGVSALAGYLELETGVRAAFAILINGLSKDESVRIEHRIISALIGAEKRDNSASSGVL